MLNHLQDCGDDFIQLDRVYFPQDMLAAAGAAAEDLRRSYATPALRAVMDQMLDLTADLVRHARLLPPMVQDGGLRRETSVIVAVAERLLDLLYRQDPLASRVELGKAGYVAAALIGIGRTLMPWGNR